MEILLFVLGIIVGVAMGYFIARSRSGALEAQVTMLTERERAAQEQARIDIANVKEELRQQHEHNIATTKEEMRQEHERNITRLEEQHREAMTAQEKRFNEMSLRLTEQMKNATADMLKQRQEEFTQSSNRDLGQIVTPLRETIAGMKQAMDESTVKHASMTSEMKTTMENMMRHSQAAKESSDKLAQVFQFGNKLQGIWGERVLDELLQSQGLTPGIHYDNQPTMRDAAGNTLKSDDGEALRPDVILHLDQQRDVIIDAKVSLSAFIDYVGEEDPIRREQHLKAHVESINRHVKELARKNYSRYIQPPKVKMDYVIMFVPHSGALWTALNAQPDLWRRAMEQNVFIADEQSLYAALRIVDLTWTQIKQAQNHEKVYALANEMLTRVGLFWKHYEDMGKALENASKAWEKGRSKITSGGQSINTTATKLIALGAKNSDKNPLPQLPEE
ncbi:DNA recombination protein RmuC [Sodaliphilus sp.]|uniref:DNA recombination protein RmuC n=1 Tax=Sodaliphilus sp. TaxID=2815818 RepID=UPI00388D32BD